MTNGARRPVLPEVGDARLGHHGLVTDPSADPLPPDPAQYDAPRNVAARKRGLEQPYIAGGADPEIEETRRRERPYVRLLVAMAIGTVALGFVLGILSALLTIPR
jgi:hypothetical protein